MAVHGIFVVNRRPLVHVLGHVHPDAIDLLKQHADVLTDADAFPSDCDAVIVRTYRMTAQDIAGCKTLKVIGKHGVGVDTIDVEAAKAAGIPVYSTPGANAQAVADLAIGFALSIIRNIHPITLSIKAGEPIDPKLQVGWDLGELDAGILGMGAVGRAVASRLIGGFGSRVSGFDPGLEKDAWPPDVSPVDDVARLFAKSRIVFVHIPLLASTRKLVDADMLARMPKGSYLVNCARGGIVDETTLADALASGHLAGAASDVFETEPPNSDNPLLAVGNFLAMPHLGASTNGGLKKVGTTIVEKVLGGLGVALR